MTSRLLIITIVMTMAAIAAMAADKTYYGYPQAKRLRDTGRILFYDNLSGSRNLTGSQLKSEIVTQSAVNSALATATAASPIIKRSGSGDGPYVRQLEVRNASGTIVYWINTLGQMVFGTPKSLAVSSVYPANGATGVANKITPLITYNKSDHPAGAIDPTGDSSANQAEQYSAFSNFSGVPGTIYTLTTNRATYVQTDGETISSCGTAMTDASGVCTSTFQMAY